MADLLEHLNQAHHNERCAQYILDSQPKYRDWAITAAFYAALHYADACYSLPGKADEASAHTVRARQLEGKCRAAFLIYRKLDDASRNVRYLRGSGSWQRVYSEENVKTLLDSLVKFRQELEKETKIDLSSK